jgi:hypothetical protein
MNIPEKPQDINKKMNLCILGDLSMQLEVIGEILILYQIKLRL